MFQSNLIETGHTTVVTEYNLNGTICCLCFNQHQLVTLLCRPLPGLENRHCRWRPSSCSRIGVVSINGGGDAPRPTPATSPEAAKATVRPSKPPNGNDWHSIEGMQTEEHRENTQELPLLSQCGGEPVQLPCL